MAVTTIHIEPTVALERMLTRVAMDAVSKAQAGELAELKAGVRKVADDLTVVALPGGPVGDVVAGVLDRLGDRLRELAA